MVKKKNQLSHYPKFFFSELIFKTVSWITFAILFISLGKKYLETDILGKIYSFFFGKEKNFKEYFIGISNSEKGKILNYAFYLILVIIILNFVSILINFYLWKNDKYIENNNFFLHKPPVFITNSLIKIACAFLITFSFVSALTVIFSLIFITFNTWILRFKKKNAPCFEEFFSWKNQYVSKIILYSAIIVLVAPFTIGRIDEFLKKTRAESPEGLAKAFKEFFNASPTTKSLFEMLSSANIGLFHWLVLIWFGRGIIFGRIKEFNDFWLKVNTIEKKVTNFKHHYYYQKSWSIANNSPINLGDYSYLENIPNFLSKSYLESDLCVNGFARENQQIVKYIEFCEKKIDKPDKKNFLNYCLFNEFNSWEDCLRTRRLIETTRK